uniref:Crustacyanin-C1 n=1 Tax=Eriocheir sinensis TaxID=95602 RepID=A0A5A4N5W5_ERISI|nr:crustacyanin-C1 [Eriocheir sinensis]
MKFLIVSVLLAVVAGLSNAGTVQRLGMFRDSSLGSCPNITNKEDLEVVPYLGAWYEIERFDIIWQLGMDCVEAIYSDIGGGWVEVHNVARKPSGEFTEIIGNATVIAPGVLYVIFAGHVPAEYHVLDTDYTTFSSVYNCFETGPERFQYAWILSRTTTLDDATYDRARQAFADNNIDLSLFHPTYQGDDCPYLGTQ